MGYAIHQRLKFHKSRHQLSSLNLKRNRLTILPVTMAVHQHIEDTKGENMYIKTVPSVTGKKTNEPVQRKIDPAVGVFAPAVPTAIGPMNTVVHGPTSSNTGTAGSNSVYITFTQPQTSPADLIGQAKWQALNVLKDPASGPGNTLTRMHQVNGILHGPSNAANMFLGTRKSNNSGANSHLHQVEKPVKNWINPGMNYECHYGVRPNFGTIPAYMQTRINNAKVKHAATPTKLATIAEFEVWASEALPDSFDCFADFYKPNAAGTGYDANKQTEKIPADQSATGVDPFAHDFANTL